MHAADSKDDLIIFECQISCHRICMQQIVKMASPINLFESLCMPDHSLLNMHAVDSKDDITFDLFDSLCMPDHFPPNIHAADSKLDISNQSLRISLHARSFVNEHASDSKDDITVDLFDSLCMPDHLPTNMHAADIKDDIS
jgi:hypothetical protein